jgi:hypothetical protein
MKGWVFQGMIHAAAIALLSGVARAGGTDDFGCIEWDAQGAVYVRPKWIHDCKR